MAVRHRLQSLAFALAVGVSIGASVHAAADAAPSRIAVSWTDPKDFHSVDRYLGSGIGRQTPEEWLAELAKHLKYRAERVLPPGEQLDVKFTNVERAGTFEPWRGPEWDDVRIIKDIYPPRIDLAFTLRAADGSVIGEGTRQLRDPAFLGRSIANETDPLRYEKRLLDDWLRKEFSRRS